MTREIIEITSEEQWLGLRKNDITSTSMSGLLNMSPYTTPFEIYHAHKNGVVLPFQASERMEKGKRMERYIAEEIALEKGWKVRPLNVYARIPELRMGSSFDFEYEEQDGSLGLMEIKGVDYFQFKKKWESSEDNGEAPEHVEIQLQHELECFDKYDKGCIVAATSIYDFHVYERQRDREFGANLREAVKRFWNDIENGVEPNPNYYRDGDVISALYKQAGGDAIDLTRDQEFEALLSKYRRTKDQATELDKEASALKYQIHRTLENNGSAFTNTFKITANWTKDTPDRVITQDMVGQPIKGRSGYRQCLVKDISQSGGKKEIAW